MSGLDVRVLVGALIAASALVAPATPAHACGDGDGGSSSGGGSSGSSGGDSSGGSSYADTAVAVPACVDGSTVVGYRTCEPFGAWGAAARLPRVSFELGPWSSMVDLADVAVTGSVAHGDGTTYGYRVVGDSLGARADVLGLRSRLVLHQGATYVGLEGGVGGIVAPGVERRAMMPGVDLSSQTAAAASAGVVAGGRVFVGRLSLGGEVMGGVRAIGVTSTSTHGDCVVEDTRWSRQPAVELRARGALWLSPWLSAGAYVGQDALGGTRSAGLELGFHLRAFDGR